jgi:DNA-binding XRE family transcriptional regulator
MTPRRRAPTVRAIGLRGPFAPLQRRAAFKAAVVLHETTVRKAAQKLGVSHQHLALVIDGERHASIDLQNAIAKFVGLRRREVFPEGLP